MERSYGPKRSFRDLKPRGGSSLSGLMTSPKRSFRDLKRVYPGPHPAGRQRPKRSFRDLKRRARGGSRLRRCGSQTFLPGFETGLKAAADAAFQAESQTFLPGFETGVDASGTAFFNACPKRSFRDLKPRHPSTARTAHRRSQTFLPGFETRDLLLGNDGEPGPKRSFRDLKPRFEWPEEAPEEVSPKRSFRDLKPR